MHDDIWDMVRRERVLLTWMDVCPDLCGYDLYDLPNKV